jgi:hypothetical protein
MKVLPRIELYHKSPSFGLDGASVEIDTDAPPPPPATLISTVVPLIAKVFPAPTKFNVVTGPDVIGVPAEEIPRLKPPIAVITPVTFKFVLIPTPPLRVSFGLTPLPA